MNKGAPQGAILLDARKVARTEDIPDAVQETWRVSLGYESVSSHCVRIYNAISPVRPIGPFLIKLDREVSHPIRTPCPPA